jgi:GNAT superfamily N-acetyltransferase
MAASPARFDPAPAIRPAVAADAARVAEILLASRAAHLPFALLAHTPDEVRAWVAQVLVPAGGVRVLAVAGVLRAMSAHALDNGGGWIEQLYVEPGHTGAGLGAQLLGQALAELDAAGAHPVRLWCFQANTGARRFYERHGFVAVAFTDGRDNEEGCPDVLYERQTGP